MDNSDRRRTTAAYAHALSKVFEQRALIAAYARTKPISPNNVATLTKLLDDASKARFACYELADEGAEDSAIDPRLPFPQ